MALGFTDPTIDMAHEYAKIMLHNAVTRSGGTPSDRVREDIAVTSADLAKRVVRVVQKV